MTPRKASEQAKFTAVAYFSVALLFGVVAFVALSSSSTVAKVVFFLGAGIFLLISIIYFAHYRNLIKREQSKHLPKVGDRDTTQ